MATPAILTASALTVPPRAFGRVLVRTKTEERGLSELPVGGPFRVHELRDELRAHPGRVAHRRSRIERRFGHAQLLELRREHRQGVLRETGAHLADVSEPRSVVDADQDLTDVPAAAVGQRVTADDEEITVAERLHGRDDVRKSAREVLKRPRPDPHAAPLATGHRADTVVLLLEDPFGALDDGRRQRREHRTDEVHSGSPVAAFATSPPSSRAIPASSRRVSTERGFAVAMSTAAALRSLRFIRSHLRSPVRTSVHDPLSFFPLSVKTMRPLRNASSKLSSPSNR